MQWIEEIGISEIQPLVLGPLLWRAHSKSRCSVHMNWLKEQCRYWSSCMHFLSAFSYPEHKFQKEAQRKVKDWRRQSCQAAVWRILLFDGTGCCQRKLGIGGCAVWKQDSSWASAHSWGSACASSQLEPSCWQRAGFLTELRVGSPCSHSHSPWPTLSTLERKFWFLE